MSGGLGDKEHGGGHSAEAGAGGVIKASLGLCKSLVRVAVEMLHLSEVLFLLLQVLSGAPRGLSTRTGLIPGATNLVLRTTGTLSGGTRISFGGWN
jgi:hypothetical protein